MLGGAQMTVKQRIMIKGVKDGLLFLLDDQCEFEELISELKYKFEKTHQQLLSGPLIHITVKLGRRKITDDQSKELTAVIRSQGNLMLQSIDSEQSEIDKLKAHAEMKIISTIIRSGQVLEYDGDLLVIGDVNPGGIVRTGGDLYVLGALKGQAHAGMHGRQEAIIVASVMKPTGLKIGDIISKPIEEWQDSDGLMEFAYIADDQMLIEKSSQLSKSNRLPIIMKGVE